MDPTIFAWSIANEPRFMGSTSAVPLQVSQPKQSIHLCPGLVVFCGGPSQRNGLKSYGDLWI